MAEKLKDYDFSGCGHGKYPFPEWTDGSIYRLTKGRDFTVKPESMRSSLMRWSKDNGYLVSTKIDGDSVVFQMLKESA